MINSFASIARVWVMNFDLFYVVHCYRLLEKCTLIAFITIMCPSISIYNYSLHQMYLCSSLHLILSTKLVPLKRPSDHHMCDISFFCLIFTIVSTIRCTCSFTMFTWPCGLFCNKLVSLIYIYAPASFVLLHTRYLKSGMSVILIWHIVHV